MVSGKPHECGKRYCDVLTTNREVCHLCSMQPLKNVLPLSDGVLYVFYDFESVSEYAVFRNDYGTCSEPGMHTTVLLAVRGH